ncbi:pickpocket protein 19-like [Frankliniella occidentalis]|uniref:Pickpocket protein 19-like n=1 Tax=Frankliniella occidentalis TaxID=133901 RepID=A0A9C6WWQ8_FRAOC|nr:pickpocket protein 19-like [Frankliniella occidentalis]
MDKDRSTVFWIREFGRAAVVVAPRPPGASRTNQQLGAVVAGPPVRTRAPPTTRQRLAAIARDFLDNAYVYGVVLASRRNIHVLDRALWVIVVLVAILITLWQLPVTYLRITQHPTTVEVRTIAKAVYNIPFPAVTICPKMKVRKRAALEYLKQNNQVSFLNESVVLPALELLQSFKVPYWLDQRPFPIYDKEVYDLFSGIDLPDFMQTVALNCSSVFKRCNWAGTEVDCCSIFRRIVSNSGLCFAFNSFTTQERRVACPLIPYDERPTQSATNVWYLNRPKTDKCGLVRATGVGLHSALEVFLAFADPLDMVLPGAQSSGYDVSVQSANENPDMSRGIAITEAGNTMTSVSVTYKEIAADPWLRTLDPTVRHCLFEEELPELFRDLDQNWYTQDTCILVCRVLFLHKNCNCFPYIILKNNQQCSLEEYRCIVQHAAGRMQWARVTPEDLPGASPEERNHSAWPDCRPCLPMCSLTAYDSEFSTSRSLYVPKHGAAAFLNVFYRDLHSAIKYTERREQEPADQFVTYCAVLNLLLGLSVLSVAQMAFYLAQALVVLWGPARRRLALLRDTCWRPRTASPAPTPRRRGPTRVRPGPDLDLGASVVAPLPFVN